MNNSHTHTNGYMNGASHTFDHEAPTSTDISAKDASVIDNDDEAMPVSHKRPEFRNANHTVRSLREMARSIEKSARRVQAETKRKEKLLARIHAAKVAHLSAVRAEYDIDAKINGDVGQRLLRNR